MKQAYKIFPWFMVLVMPLTSSGQELVLQPSTMLITMPSGYLEVQEIELHNTGDREMAVSIDYDTSWIDINPAGINIGAGLKRKVLVFLFIPQDQQPQRQGEIIFYKQGSQNELGRVRVLINPTPDQEKAIMGMQMVNHASPAVSPQGPAQDELIQDLKYRITELEQEVEASRYLINNLKDELNRKEVEMLKLLESSRSGKSDFETMPFPQLDSQKQNASTEILFIFQLLQNALGPEIQQGKAVLKLQNGNIYFSIPGQIAFMSGSKYLRLQGEKILDRFANVLREYENKNFQLMVIGHSDSIQYRGDTGQKTFGNWELSALRAAKVIKLLQHKTMYNGGKLLAACNSSYSPIANNKTKEGRIKNRRIEILVSDLIQTDQ